MHTPTCVGACTVLFWLLLDPCFAWWTMITTSTTVHSTMNTRLHLGSSSGCGGASVLLSGGRILHVL